VCKKLHPFKPIVFKDTKVLILGSFPSKKSFEKNFYYAHPQNQFWKILSALTNYPVNNRDQKIWLLKEAHIGLWDVIGSCLQESSLDSSIYDEELNDIAGLLEAYPSITKIACTGKKAYELYSMHFAYLGIEPIYLPSPSSAYVAMKIEQKIAIYEEKLEL
jgi:hypoxanthine-DNA glycosylase